jgi:hypothetical protein
MTNADRLILAQKKLLNRAAKVIDDFPVDDGLYFQIGEAWRYLVDLQQRLDALHTAQTGKTVRTIYPNFYTQNNYWLDPIEVTE